MKNSKVVRIDKDLHLKVKTKATYCESPMSTLMNNLIELYLECFEADLRLKRAQEKVRKNKEKAKELKGLMNWHKEKRDKSEKNNPK